jgi:hypothetical protein
MLANSIDGCGRVMMSVGPSRCAADSTAQDYHQAFKIRRHNIITGVAPSPTPMPAQYQLHY